MRLFCDMDGVLVKQTSRKRFDLMGWMPDGRVLWDFIKLYSPTILSQLMSDIWGISRYEKQTWVRRELGSDVPVIVVHGETGKQGYSAPGHVLIDDSPTHEAPWVDRGGIFILHRSSSESVERLKAIL